MKFRLPSGSVVGLTLFLLLINLMGSLPAFAASPPAQKQAGQGSVGGKAATVRAVSQHTVVMSDVPPATPQQVASARQHVLPQPGFNAAQRDRLKAFARANPNAPRGTHPQSAPRSSGARVHPFTPGTTTSFQGMADSASTCPFFGGCAPPDMALAASSRWVLQGVNTSFAVSNTSGSLQSGWPKTAQSFFGIPNPGSCSPAGPFLSDPRAFYDPVDRRFWVAMLEAEGALGVNSCPEKTLYWIAVSRTSDPRGAWNVFAFDMRAGQNTTNVADFVQFGFNQSAIFFSADMFDQSGSTFQYEEIFGARKSSLESGSFPGFFGFIQLFASVSSTVLVDDVQPVEAFNSTSGGLFLSSFNGGQFGQFQGDPFGDNCTTVACHGLVVWALSNPGTSSTGLTGIIIDSNSYILPPGATQQGSSGQVNTGDNRISGTPTYRNGQISFSLNTSVAASGGVNVSNVSGLMWGQVAPTLNASGALTGASLTQQGLFFYSGDSSTYYGTLMPNAAGGLLMVFEFSSDTFSPGAPGIAYVTRSPSTPAGSFSDGGLFLRQGDAATFDSRWGDFEAASYNGNQSQGGSDTVWFAGEYSPSNQDWSTFIGSANF